jgi:hypothetical protein|tara:strand:+ start:1339 stop:1638 length:300 start_codon:yes stop_codon:yes gene_type:complete
MIKFVEVVHEAEFNSHPAASSYSLGEVWINEETVIKVRNVPNYKQLLRAGRTSPELEQNHHFTSITLNNCGIMETHVVVGEADIVAAKLNRNKKQLLKG